MRNYSKYQVPVIMSDSKFRLVDKRITAILIGSIIAAGCLGPRQEKSVFDEDPIVFFAHGTFFWEAGIEQPDTAYLLAVQNHYVLKYQNLLDSNIAESQRLKRVIDDIVVDEVIANGLYLDWLIQQAASDRTSADSATVSTVRWYYKNYIYDGPKPTDVDNYWSFGITDDIAESLKFDGLDIFEAPKPKSSDYIDACVSAGVPIPDRLFDDSNDQWRNAGFMEDRILGPGASTNPVTGNELWVYLSDDPTGVCLSLRRFWGGDPPRGHFDLICLGLESNNACFFESEGFDNETNLDGAVNTSSISAGEDTQVAAPCTACHIGENPFIVHPLDQAFEKALAAKSEIGNPLSWSGTDFYQAFEVQNWPQNPPPLKLSKIDSQERCSDCHQNSRGGRFPNIPKMPVPFEYRFYCNLVLEGVLGLDDFSATMPMGDPDAPGYDGHKAELLAMCDHKDGGRLVDNEFSDDVSVVSPPHIVVPLNQCARAAYVEDYVNGAEVELIINDNVVETIDPAIGTAATEFSNFGQLEEGDIVQARQRVDGTWSELTRPIIVSNYKDIYPDGLPAPTIDPSTIYACASTVAVRYAIPGFEVEVKVDGDDPVTALTFAGYKPIQPGKTPFEIGDEFTAQVKACGDLSPISDAVLAQRPSSSTLTDALINPVSMYEGQEFINIGSLTYGSSSEVMKEGDGSGGGFITPMSWMNFGLNSPLALSDKLVVTQNLCDFSSQPSFAQSPTVLECLALPPPVINDPLPGKDFVTVIETLLGSRVRIYDESENELGDGTGSVIVLTRALTDGELVSVTQQIGDCISRQAYEYEVRGPEWPGL